MGAIPPALTRMGILALLLAVGSQVMGAEGRHSTVRTPRLLRRGRGQALRAVQAWPVHLQGPGQRAALRGPDEPMDLSFLGTCP